MDQNVPKFTKKISNIYQKGTTNGLKINQNISKNGPKWTQHGQQWNKNGPKNEGKCIKIDKKPKMDQELIKNGPTNYWNWTKMDHNLIENGPTIYQKIIKYLK